VRGKLVVVALVLACSAIAFVLGRRTAPAPETAAAASTEPSAVKPDTARRRPLVCTPARSSGSDHDENASCEQTELLSRWCASELDECRRQRGAVRQQWPEEDTIESPGEWTEAIDQALDACDLGVELETIDCTEYPCAASLRPTNPGMTPAEHEQEMNRLTEAARHCAPLRTAFGLDDATAEKAIDVFRLDSKCGDARENFFVLMALKPEGGAYRLITKEDADPGEERDMWRWMYRRADDLAGLWECAQR
jgi:hypothetical protein